MLKLPSLHKPSKEAQMRSPDVAWLLHEHLEVTVISPYNGHN